MTETDIAVRFSRAFEELARELRDADFRSLLTELRALRKALEGIQRDLGAAAGKASLGAVLGGLLRGR